MKCTPGLLAGGRARAGERRSSSSGTRARGREGAKQMPRGVLHSPCARATDGTQSCAILVKAQPCSCIMNSVWLSIFREGLPLLLLPSAVALLALEPAAAGREPQHAI